MSEARRPRSPVARRAGLALAIAGTAAVLVLTLSPGDADAPSSPWSCVLCGELGLADAIGNVLLFVPLGLGLRLLGAGWAQLTVVAAILSSGIELAQWRTVPGRDAGLADVAWNVVGTLAGATLAGALPARRSLGRAAPAGLALVALAAVGGALMQPVLPSSVYYGQWTPQLGHLERYHGKVLGVEIAGAALPSRRLGETPTVRRLLEAGATLRVVAVAGPAPAALAPVFSIFDDRQREILLIGFDHTDVVVRVRARAAALRLVQPEARWRGALQGMAAGDTLLLGVRREGRATCVSIGDASEHCVPRSTGARAWRLVQVPPGLSAAAQCALDVLTMALLGALVGAVLPRGRAGLAVVLVTAAGVTVAGWLASGVVPWWDVMGVGLGLVVGALLPSAA